VRETFLSIAKNDSLKEKYYAYYFKKLKRLNMEHEFSGVKHMPLNEFYDMDIENIKSLLVFLFNTHPLPIR
jgi:hypothetical protein